VIRTSKAGIRCPTAISRGSPTSDFAPPLVAHLHQLGPPVHNWGMKSDSNSGEIQSSSLGIPRNICVIRKSTPSMDAANNTCHDSDDVDTLTVMNEDVVMDASSSNDARNVSQVH
jgi:hypothetical protein